MLYETELTFNYVLLIWCDAGCVVGGGMWGIVVVRLYQAPFNPWHLKVPYTHTPYPSVTKMAKYII